MANPLELDEDDAADEKLFETRGDLLLEGEERREDFVSLLLDLFLVDRSLRAL